MPNTFRRWGRKGLGRGEKATEKGKSKRLEKGKNQETMRKGRGG